MKFNKEILKTKKFQSILGWTTLVVLIVLLIIKLWLGHCRLWLCGLFTGTVTAYFILSEHHTKNNKEQPPSSR